MKHRHGPVGSLTLAQTKAYSPFVVHRGRRSDDGVVLVEFALVSVVFFALLFGGLFVLMDTIAKGQLVAGVTNGAELAAADTLDGNQLSSCATHPPLDSVGLLATGNTLSMLCEIEQTIGTDVLGTDPASLEVAIQCVDRSGPTTCGSAIGVWVCARAWSPWDYPAIISPGWLTSENYETVPKGVTLTFHNFSPANPLGRTGPLLGCP